MTNQITPAHANLYAVEEIVVFRTVTLIRAEDAESAQAIHEYSPVNGFQQQVSNAVTHVEKITEDAQIVRILQTTEQPGMTLERFTGNRDNWLRNCIVE